MVRAQRMGTVMGQTSTEGVNGKHEAVMEPCMHLGHGQCGHGDRVGLTPPLGRQCPYPVRKGLPS